MTTGNGGWIVFQRRVDATVDFYRNWTDYKDGFGDLKGNFWMGLEKLHKLAAPGKGAKLRVDVRGGVSPGEAKYAEYSLFEIRDESDGYRLIIGGYTGNAGDSLTYHNNMKFSTKDRDQDTLLSINCSKFFKGAWWYASCYSSNLNGLYPINSVNDGRFIVWSFYCIFSEMKIKY